mgnify:FL=1
MGEKMIDWDMHVSATEFDDTDYEYDSRIHPDQKMTIEEWKEACEFGIFIDYDGQGEVFGEVDGVEKMLGVFSPSQRHEIPDTATYIIWYNR